MTINLTKLRDEMNTAKTQWATIGQRHNDTYLADQVLALITAVEAALAWADIRERGEDYRDLHFGSTNANVLARTAAVIEAEADAAESLRQALEPFTT